VVAAALCLGVHAQAQETSGPRFLSIDATQAPAVRITVDPADVPLPTLERMLVADGEEARLGVAVEPGDPLWLVVVIDCGPGAAVERHLLSAAAASLAGSLPSDTQIAFILAGETVRTIGFARGPDRLRAILSEAFQAPVARVRDGVVAGIDLLHAVQGARGMIVLHATRDDASHVGTSAPALLAPLAGCPLHSIAPAGAAEPSVVEAARSTGGQVHAFETGSEAVDACAALGAGYAERATLRYDSPEAPAGWRSVRLLLDDEVLAETTGYLPAAGPRAVGVTPEIASPVPLPPTPIVFYTPGRSALQGWTMAGRAASLAPGLYRGIALLRSNLVRSVTVSEPGRFAFAELGALRVRAPSADPGPHPLEIQTDGLAQRVGGARTGEWVPLPPGAYRVASTGGPSYRSDRIVVVEGTRHELDLSRWAILSVEASGPDGIPLSAPLSMEQEGLPPQVSETNVEMAIPPGAWRVSVATRPPTEIALDLPAGARRTVTLAPLGALRVGLLDSAGQSVQWAWIARPAGMDEPMIAGLTGLDVPMVAGAYDVQLAGWPEAVFEARIEEGEVTEHSLGRLVRLLVDVLDHNGEPTRVKYNVIDSVTGAPLASGVTGEPQDVLPGQYELDLWTYPRLLVTDMAIEGAEDGLVQFGPTGAVALAMGEEGRIGLYRLREDRAPEPAVVIDAGEVLEVVPGRYSVTVLSPKGVKYRDEIVVRGGEVTRVELPPRDVLEEIP
jgi:hypothetical protein